MLEGTEPQDQGEEREEVETVVDEAAAGELARRGEIRHGAGRRDQQEPIPDSERTPAARPQTGEDRGVEEEREEEGQRDGPPAERGQRVETRQVFDLDPQRQHRDLRPRPPADESGHEDEGRQAGEDRTEQPLLRGRQPLAPLQQRPPSREGQQGGDGHGQSDRMTEVDPEHQRGEPAGATQRHPLRSLEPVAESEEERRQAETEVEETHLEEDEPVRQRLTVGQVVLPQQAGLWLVVLAQDEGDLLVAGAILRRDEGERPDRRQVENEEEPEEKGLSGDSAARAFGRRGHQAGWYQAVA